MKSDRSWIGSMTIIERVFPMERTSAPQPSATAQPTATLERVLVSALKFRLGEALGARRSQDGVRGRDGV